MKGYPEIHKVVSDTRFGTGNAGSPSGVIGFPVHSDWMKSFWIHGICIHHDVVKDAIAISSVNSRKGIGGCSLPMCNSLLMQEDQSL